MKLQIIPFMAGLLFTFLACSSTPGTIQPEESDTTSQKSMRLSVRGTELVNDAGENVVLKGISYGWHNWWPRFYNASTVKYFADDWKCSVVRAAMGVEPDGGYLQNPQKAVECVQAVADAAISNGIYVIIDWHSHEIHTEAAKAFFKNMAERYKGVPNVIYEIFNEPVEDSWEQVKQYAEQVIPVIRAVDPDALILVGSPHWDQDVHLAADNPITGYQNIMYTLHYYANTHRDDLRRRADYALGKGLPLFVSECAGMEASGDGAIDYAEWDKWQQWMKKNSISWVAWSIADKNETCSMITTSGASTGYWQDDQIKEWGKAVRSGLQAK